MPEQTREKLLEVKLIKIKKKGLLIKLIHSQYERKYYHGRKIHP